MFDGRKRRLVCGVYSLYLTNKSKHLAKIKANDCAPTKWKISKLTLNEPSQWLLIRYCILFLNSKYEFE